jgi:hypothetical protein
MTGKLVPFTELAVAESDVACRVPDLDRPTISYEEPDPASERRPILVRLGKRHRNMLDELSETFGITRTRLIRKLIELAYQGSVEASEPQWKKLLSEHSMGKKADKNRRRRLRRRFANGRSD